VGIPAVVCGPGTIDDAHQPDESIAVDQLRAGERFVGRLIDHLTGAAPRA
jgi:acetylornithine deacetylase